jgi:hypothetical protein
MYYAIFMPPLPKVGEKKIPPRRKWQEQDGEFDTKAQALRFARALGLPFFIKKIGS